MLGDRDYMRGPSRRPPLTMLNKLFIALVAAFIFQNIDQVYMDGGVTRFLVLSSEGIGRGYIWQFFTYSFLHGGLFHILCNCLMFWIVGRAVEQIIGARRLLVAFLGAGVFGGILQITLMFLFPKIYGGAVVGASAGVAGVFAIFAMLFRDQVFRVYFILPVKAETLLWISVAIAGFFTLVPPRDGVAHAAHLGGLIGGIMFVRLGWHQDFQPLPWDGWWANFRAKRSKRPFIQRVDGPPAQKQNSKALAKEEDPDFIASQVDPILDKISEKGLHSLTDKEREILEKARNRMGKR